MTKPTSITVINAICICAALFITACSNDRELTEVSNDSPPAKINKREYKTRSIEEAKAIAADFFAQSVGNIHKQSNIKRAQAEPTVQVLIKDSLPNRPGDKAPIDILPDTLMYAISSVNGTIMIPADSDAPTIVGVFDNPNVSLTKLLKKNNGLNPLYEILKPAFNPDIFHNMTHDDWVKTILFDPLDIDIPDYDDPNSWGPNFYIPTKISVEWDQGVPFNNDCPLINDQHALAGCVAIAVAQSMTLTGVPDFLTSYSGEFSDISKFKNGSCYAKFPEIGNKVSQLIARIGSAVDMKYGLYGSGARVSNAVHLLTVAGKKYRPGDKYIKQTLQQYDKGFILVASEPDNGQSGHCYLIDGYRLIKQNRGYKYYMHVNYGWGPGYNGYFLVDLFNPHFDPNMTRDSDGNLIQTFPNRFLFYCFYK